jgi:hypothetical protein
MKSLLKQLSVFICFLFFLISCDVTDSDEITGSGDLVTIEENITGFTEVRTGYAFESVITKDSEYGILITVDDNLEKYLKVYKLGSALYIQMEDNNYIDADLKVEIKMPDIEKLDLSGASVGHISGFNLTHDMSIVLSGASNLNGNINTENINVVLSGASNLTLSGNGNNLSLDASGASVIDLGNFNLTDDADILLSGASVSTINLNGNLNADLSGASVLYYYGNPSLGSIALTGGSTVQNL